MSAARLDFLARIHAYELAAAHGDLVNRGPKDREHNDRARILRNGLAVIGFATLEDFLRRRTGELIVATGGARFPFSQLPLRMREAMTKSVIDALRFQMRLNDREAYIRLVQDHATKIASTSALTGGFQPSEFAFGHDASNLAHGDIKEVLGDFKVRDGWGMIDRLLARGVGGIWATQGAFESAAKRRHSAAHEASFDAPITDLSAFVRIASGIACGFDILLSRAIDLLLVGDRRMLDDNFGLDQTMIVLAYVRPKGGGKWTSILQTARRAWRTSPSQIDALVAAKQNSKIRRNSIIVTDAQGIIRDWYPVP